MSYGQTIQQPQEPKMLPPGRYAVPSSWRDTVVSTGPSFSPQERGFPFVGGLMPDQQEHISLDPALPLVHVSSTSPKVIFVVDDSLTVRKILETCLQRAGFEVQTFADGIALLRWLATPKAHIPDLIFLDLVLPKMDGYTVAQHVKAQPLCKQTILLFLSQKDGILDKLKGHLVGARGYLTKPFRTEDILKTVACALDLALPAQHPHGSSEKAGIST